MNIYYVYVYLRTRTSSNGPAGSPYYIGKGKNNRIFGDHSTCSAKPPKDKRFAIKIFENLCNSEASKLEQGLIKIFGRLDLKTGCLRNQTDGGDGTPGHIRSQESRVTSSNSIKEFKHTELAKKKMSIAHTGKILSEEHKRNISLSNKSADPIVKQKLSDANKGINNSFYGKTHSAEARKKMKEAKRNLSQLTRDKMSLSAKNRWKQKLSSK